MWSFEDNVISCAYNKFFPNQAAIQKAVLMRNNQQMLYYLNGKNVNGKNLALLFASMEDISDRIAKFNTTVLCQDILDANLFTMVKSSRLSCDVDKTNSCLRSSGCQQIAENNKLCASCRKMKNYLRKQLKNSSTKQKVAEVHHGRGSLITRMKQSKLDGCRRKMRSIQLKEKVSRSL